MLHMSVVSSICRESTFVGDHVGHQLSDGSREGPYNQSHESRSCCVDNPLVSRSAEFLQWEHKSSAQQETSF